MSRTIGIFTESSDKNPEIDLCRLCREKHDCYYSIFTSNVACEITVKDALHDLVGLQITVGDGLPTTMCPLCLKKLTEFSVFKKICLESNAVLRKFLPRSCFRSFEGGGADNEESEPCVETKDCIQHVIENTSEFACSAQMTEVYIPVPDCLLPRDDKLFHVKDESEDPLSEGNSSLLCMSDPAAITSDASDALATDDPLLQCAYYKGTKANSLTELKKCLAQKKISLTLLDNVQGYGTSSETPSLPDAEVTTISPEDISIPQFPSQSNGMLLEHAISRRVPHSQEEFFNFSFCAVPSLSPERASSPKQGKSCDASLNQVPSSSRNVLAGQVSPNRDDFQRSVLLALREINEKVEVLAANQARLSLHLLPSDKVITRPSGIPPLPVHTEVDLRKVEAYLMESDQRVSDLSMYLSVHVSSNKDQEYKNALKVVAQVMGNSLAKEYSFKGQRGENSFSDLKLWTGVKGAIFWKLGTDIAESERAVKSWLKDAAYRSQLDGSVTSKKIQQGTSQTLNS